jgi:hypothetical protein
MQGELRPLPRVLAALPVAAGHCAPDRGPRAAGPGAGPRLDWQPGSQLDRIVYGRHEQHRVVCISFRTPTLPVRVEEEGEGVRGRMRGSNAFSPSRIRSSAEVDLSPNAWAAGPAQAQAQENCGSSALGAVRCARS